MASDGAFFNPSKKLKEDFVSNLDGTSLLEIASISAIVPVFILLRQWDVFNLKWDQGVSAKIEIEKHSSTNTGSKDWRNYTFNLIIDFCLIVLPVLSFLTILADWTFVLTVCLVLLALFRIFCTRFWPHSGILSQTKSASTSYWKQSLSSSRFIMMLLTSLSILAVDFRIFPRRYAKTETYGTGLMDLGVGSFVVANAMVSRQARDISMKDGDAIKRVAPLLLLGFARSILTKGVDYQVHAGEYGVHWNFFFTLAAVVILTSMIHIRPQYCGFFGCLILVVYQVALLCGLNKYLLSDGRGTNIFSLNKEGIFSLFGYWGLYLVSVNIGYHLYFLRKPISARIVRVEGQSRLLIEVWLLCGLFWGLTILFDQFVEKISRRMCNFAYTSFVLAVNAEVVGIIMLAYLIPTRKQLVIVEVFNQNLLASFLLANILTGLINISVETLFVSPFVAYCILLAYAVALVSGVAILKFCDLKLKF
ncbi:hypothetical protein SUGI_0804640 [Cryptomeria japonica]|uniref:uncharacterized protein At4g17910 n=1 Tax=Cryptomeria japonica TaxID=3369 RepID=UPI0024147EAB|nr:uncharacterized protein At4g17910 [Cryptomeria japonica]GLJ39401.1 hypothetical protein SUGI_0804640 [Cryptomeria japonica]